MAQLGVESSSIGVVNDLMPETFKRNIFLKKEEFLHKRRPLFTFALKLMCRNVYERLENK